MAAPRLPMRDIEHQLVARSDRESPVFDPCDLEGLPDPAQRYLRYSLPLGTPLSTRVRLRMAGDFSLGSPERPNRLAMQAVEILAPPQGFVWRPRIGSPFFWFSGSDGLQSDQAWTRFSIYGLIPVVRVQGGADMLRSALGRMFAEAVLWTPAILLPGSGVAWEPVDASSARAIFTAGDDRFDVTLAVDEDGRPQSVALSRWTNANAEKVFRYQPFGGRVLETAEFDGYRIASSVEVSNLFGTDDEFPFFRARILGATFLP